MPLKIVGCVVLLSFFQINNIDVQTISPLTIRRKRNTNQNILDNSNLVHFVFQTEKNPRNCQLIRFNAKLLIIELLKEV